MPSTSACDWILVTNLREIRLYHKNRDQRTFERFEIQALAEHEAAFRQLVFLLAAERVVPAAGPGHLDELLKASEASRPGADPAVLRGVLPNPARHPRPAPRRQPVRDPRNPPLLHPEAPRPRALHRLRRGSRPVALRDAPQRAFKHHDPYNPTFQSGRPFKASSGRSTKGNGDLNIPGYNGGLFARDPGLDRIAVPDEVCAELKRLGDYDYRSPAATDAASAGLRLVDVEILGHIFERSITDLELHGAGARRGPLSSWTPWSGAGARERSIRRE